MMKKIVVLVLVLGIASAANATLSLSVNGNLDPVSSEIYLLPSEVAVINIHGDGQSAPGTSPYLAISGPGSISGYTMVYGGTLSGYMELEQLAIEFGITEAEMLSYFDGLGITAVDCSWAILNDGAIPQKQLTGVLVDNIMLHCEDRGDVTISLVSEAFDEVFDSVVIHQIPEPITFALLGLGGLFLRRRK
jgi:hypothetical protein